MKPLDAWLDRIAAADARRPRLQQALVTDRLARYFGYRLRFVALGRAVALVVHIIEFLLLARSVDESALLVGVGVSNALALVAAYWWGALEVLRERIRAEDLRGGELAEAVGRWMAVAARIASVVLVVGIGSVTVARVRSGGIPGVLDAYVIAVCVRVAADVWVRSFYSGVYARRRVYRPMVAVIGIEVLGLGLLAALWPWLGSITLPLVVLVTAIASRALLWQYSRRAYVGQGLEIPSTRWKRAWRGTARASLRRALLAGLAGASVRVGSIVVLSGIALGLGDSPTFVYTFHLIAPVLTTAGAWAQVFYLDFKWLEGPRRRLARRVFRRGLARCGAVVGLVAWVVAVAVVVPYARQDAVAFLVALLAVMQAQAQLGRLQLEYFARGQWLRVVAGSLVVAAVAGVGGWSVASGPQLGLRVLLTVAAGIAAGVLVVRWLVLRPVSTADPEPLQRDLHAFGRALVEQTEPLQVGRLELEPRRKQQVIEVAGRLAAEIGSAGVVHPHGRREVLWFARADAFLDDDRILRCAAGLASAVDVERVDSGRAAFERTGVRDGWAPRLPAPGHADDAPPPCLADALAQGDVVALVDFRSRRVNPVARVLDAEAAMSLWGQAQTMARGGRRTPERGWEGIVLLEGESVAVIIGVPTTIDLETRAAWRHWARRRNWAQLGESNAALHLAGGPR